MRKKIENLKEQDMNQNAYNVLGPDMIRYIVDDLQMIQNKDEHIIQFIVQIEHKTCFEVKRLLELVQKGMISHRSSYRIYNARCGSHMNIHQRERVNHKVFNTRENINNRYNNDTYSDSNHDSFDSNISTNQYELDQHYRLLKNIEDTQMLHERGDDINDRLSSILNIDRGHGNVRDELARLSFHTKRKIKSILKNKTRI